MAKASTVAKANSGGVVTIACNMPNGVVLRLDKMVDQDEMTTNGVRTVKVAEKIGEIRLHGTAKPFGEERRCAFVAGFALTPNVPAADWEHWLKDNQNSALVHNGCIFAYEKREDVEAAARDHRDVKSGLQPLDMRDPQKEPRVPRDIKKGDRDNNDGDGDADQAAA